MNALEREYAENVQRAARREGLRIGVLIIAALAAPTGAAALLGHGTVALAALPTLICAIVVWDLYNRLRKSPPQPEPEPAPEAEQVERGYRSPMFIRVPARRHRTFAQRLGRVVGAWRNRRNTQQMIEWERVAEEKR